MHCVNIVLTLLSAFVCQTISKHLTHKVWQEQLYTLTILTIVIGYPFCSCYFLQEIDKLCCFIQV